MKKLFTALVILSPLWVFAQIPVGLNYQAIAWDSQNVPMAGRNIEVMFEILQGPPGSGTVVTEFEELHNVTTNDAGLFTLTIGSVRTSQFSKIDWTKTPKYLRVTIDKVVAPFTPMLSVPYAQYAERTNLQAGDGIRVEGNTITNIGDADNDAKNEIQQLTYTGNSLSLNKNGGSIDVTQFNKPLYKTLSSVFEMPANSFNRDLPGMQLTIPEKGVYMVQASALVVIPTEADPDAVAYELLVGGVKVGIVEDDLGESYVSGFFIANFEANQTIKLTINVVFFGTTDLAKVYNAYLLVRKIE